MKDNIILDIAVVFGISMAMAVLSGCITVVLLRTVLHPPGIGRGENVYLMYLSYISSAYARILK